MISTDFNKLKRLAYEYENLGLSERQGEAILNFLKMPPGATVRIRDLIGADQMNKIKAKVRKNFIIFVWERVLTSDLYSLSHQN